MRTIRNRCDSVRDFWCACLYVCEHARVRYLNWNNLNGLPTRNELVRTLCKTEKRIRNVKRYAIDAKVEYRMESYHIEASIWVLCVAASVPAASKSTAYQPTHTHTFKYIIHAQTEWFPSNNAKKKIICFLNFSCTKVMRKTLFISFGWIFSVLARNFVVCLSVVSGYFLSDFPF